MPTNFDFLKNDEQFAPFADMAVCAEQVYNLNPAVCATTCRSALEFCVKWLYSVDESLNLPYDQRLSTLTQTADFHALLPEGLFPKIKYIRKLGNNATHNARGVTKDQAALALEYLHSFMDFVACCYSSEYHEAAFNRSLLEVEAPAAAPAPQQLDVQQLMVANAPVRKRFTVRRKQALAHGYTVKPIDLSEASTRKAYIDVMLTDAGWVKDSKNWVDEYPIDEMPNKSGVGYADYVLFGDDGLPLAVVEAKRTSVSVEKGRQQAVLYANFLEKKYGRRPFIFLTNGYETRLWDDKHYPERQVSGIFSKRDLEKAFNLQAGRKTLRGVQIKDEITNRYYQKEAIQQVCDSFDGGNRRKALLVMATGSGKTRTVISLVDVLQRQGWIKNVLFLADRTALVVQAKRAFHNMMPNLSLCNLVEGKEEASNRVVFSTYQTMMNCIDDTRDNEGNRLFTPGHFDLIVVDEAHRSIYNKYKDIFTYFDALLVGLTATPKAEVGKSTYEIFELQNGVPTYGYELAQAVADGYLVDYTTVETELKFLSEGITYADLSEEEKEEYENTFTDENGVVPDRIESSALNEWIFNHDTIKKALNLLMEHGHKVDFGSKIGKTIIFAKNHLHAEEILKVWGQEYPDYPPHYCRVIDNYENYAQSLIDDFSEPAKLPQIAVSVDMLDTGIDVPELLNLVFFKKVLSKAKFWQMIGRGTRLCEKLVDGEDKQNFYIFDLCGNFAFFREQAHGREAATTASLQERLFNTKVNLIYKLQDFAVQVEELRAYRDILIEDVVRRTASLNRDNFAVRQHLRMIDRFVAKDAYAALSYENTLQIAEHIAPLMAPDGDDISAVRFDMLLYQIELALAAGSTYTKARNDLAKKAQQLSHYTNIPQVAEKKELIAQLARGDMERMGLLDYEQVRKELRGLIKFIDPDERNRYNTNFTDDILSVEWNESQLENDDLANYKRKVRFYIKQHQDNPAIAKLKTNVPLEQGDVTELEKILWSDLGTKEQYEKEYGETPLGELVRSIVGLERKAANEAFSAFLSAHQLDSRQMHFVEQVVNYIVKNGMMKDLSVLQQSPFKDMGSVVDLFENTAVFMDLRSVIDMINYNAVA